MGTTVAELTATIRAEGTARTINNINKVGDAGENTSSRIVAGNKESSKSFVDAAKSAAILGAAFYGIKKASDVLFSAINTTREFEASVSDLSAITGATGKDLEFLAKKSREFGATTTLSATQAAEAFKLIASAKPDLLDNAEALSKVTKEAITLAEASGSTLPEAAATLGSALNQFGADADQAGKFINVLAAGAKFGASEIADTALALRDSGTVAASAGISFEELNAGIQALSTVSIKGSRAGVGLRNVILKLQKDGYSLSEETGGLVGALQKLLKSGADTTEIMKLFGLENVTAAQSLIDNADKLENLTEKLTGTGVAYDQARIKQDNLTGDLKKLNSAWEDFQLTLVGSTGPLRSVVQGATQTVLSLSDSMDELAIAGAAIASLLAGQLAKSVITHTISVTKNVLATNAQTKAILAQQAAQTAALGVKASYAAAELAEAQAAVAAASGIKRLAITQNVLVPAQAKAAAAAAAHATALKTLRSATINATIAVRGFKTVVGVLGGPAGIIATAITALSLWASTAKTATAETEDLNKSTSDLAANMSQFDVAASIKKARDQIKGYENAIAAIKSTQTGSAAETRVAAIQTLIDNVSKKIGGLQNKLKDLKDKDKEIQGILGQGESVAVSSSNLPTDTSTVGNNANAEKISELSKSLLSQRDLLAANLAERRKLVDDFYGEDVSKAAEKADLLFRIEEDYTNRVEALDAASAQRRARQETDRMSGSDLRLQSNIDSLQESVMSEEEILQESYDRRTFMVEDAFQNQIISEQRKNELIHSLEEKHQESLVVLAQKSEAKKRAVMTAGLNAASNIFSGLSTLMGKEGKKQSAMQKTLARAAIVTSTAQAVMNALAVPPYPLGLALAAGAALQGAIQLKNVNTGSITSPSGNVNISGINAASSGAPLDSTSTMPSISSVQKPDENEKGKLTVIFQGDMIGWDEHVRETVINDIKNLVDNHDVTLISSTSRNALDLAAMRA